jgi:hypothetical protein
MNGPVSRLRQLMVLSESAAQELSNELSCRYVSTNNGTIRKLMVPSGSAPQDHSLCRYFRQS